MRNDLVVLMLAACALMLALTPVVAFVGARVVAWVWFRAKLAYHKRFVKLLDGDEQ